MPQRLFQIITHARLRRHFAVERTLLNGRHISHSDAPSVLHFTVNRAASQWVRSMMRQCAGEAGLTPVDMSQYAYRTDFPYLYGLPPGELRQYLHVFRPRGYLYSVFNGFIPGIPRLEEFRILLVLRDPRDTLVSWYYSEAYSHERPPRSGDKHVGFDAGRSEARKIGIDEYVLKWTPDLKQRFGEYTDHLVGRDNVCFVKYADLVERFEPTLDRMVKTLGLAIPAAMRDQFIQAAAEATPEKENIHGHLRQRLPGDYRRKLKPETIDRLNREWWPFLEKYGWPIRAAPIDDAEAVQIGD